jgi:hypothetical protein
MADNYDFGDQVVPQNTQPNSYDFGDAVVSQPTQDPGVNKALQNHFEGTIGGAAKANVDADGKSKAFSLEDAWQAGWQNSVSGLLDSRQLPSKVLPQDASTVQNIASGAAQMAGDLPFSVMGFGIGLAGGAASGPGATVLAMGGAFALPAAMRSILMDGYQKGDFKTPSDFIERASSIMLNTAKGYITGVGTALTGGGTAAATEALGGSATMATAAGLTASSIATTELSKRLDGQVPSWSDFITNAALMFGFHSIGMGTDKLSDIYKKTGVQPSQVAADAAVDPVVKTELLSGQQVPTKYQGMPGNTEEPAAASSPQNPAAAGLPVPLPKGDVGEPATPADTGPGKGFTDEEKAAYAKVGESIVTDYPDKVSPKASFNSFYYNMVDNFNPIKRVQEQLSNGAELKPSENPYMLMRLLRGGYERANQFVSYNTVDYDTYKPNGDSLATVLAPLKDGEGNLDGLRKTMAALRSVELEGRGIKTGVDQEAANVIGLSDEAYRVYGKMAEGVTAFSNRVLDYARDAGYFDNKTAALLKEMNKYYVPFNRVLENPEEMDGQVGANNPFKTIEGSDKQIFDPIANVIKNAYQVTALAERNAAKVTMVQLARSAGEVGEGKLFEPVSGEYNKPMRDNNAITDLLTSTGITLSDDSIKIFKNNYSQTTGADQVSIVEDGVRKVYNVGDHELALALQGSTPEAHGLFFKIHAAVNSWARAGAILDPAFLPKHMVRQNINAGVYSENDLIPFVSMARGISTLLAGDTAGGAELLQSWRSSGGMNSDFAAMDRRYVENKINEIEGNKPMAQAIQQMQDNPLFIGKLPYNAALTAMDYEHALIAWHDNTLRVEEFRQSLAKYQTAGMEEKDAILQAGFDSRNLLTDYMRRGAAMGSINQLSMFANMKIQGLDKMATAIGDNTGRTLAKLSLLVAVPTVLNWVANHNNPRYQQQEDWQKDTNWVVPIDDWRTPKAGDILPVDLQGKDVPWMTRTNDAGQKEYNFGPVVRIPKPVENGQLFGSLIEHFLDYASGQDNQTWGKLGNNILGDILPEYVPTLERPMLEQWANKSRFTNGPLVSSAAESRLPAQQYTPYTTELAKTMGKMIGTLPGVDTQGISTTLSVASPAVVENYVRGWGSSLGMTLLRLADQGLRNAGALDNPTMPTPTLADNMFIKGFVARYPTSSTQNIEDFNEQFKGAFKTYNSMQFLAKGGDMPAALKLAQTEPFMQQIMKDKQAMDVAQSYITRISADPKMPPNDKRQLIESGYYQLSSMADQANTQLKLMAAAANKGPLPQANPNDSVPANSR